MSLNDDLDLKKAYKRVMQDRRDDTLPDIVDYQDYGRLLEQNLDQLRSQIQKPNLYQPNSPSHIDIPKKGFTLRPVLAPQINDRIAYQALADLLIPHFKQEACVYSNKPTDNNNSSRMFKQGIELWLDFQKDEEKYCEIYPFVVETDITAYFEHIGHKALTNRLQDLFAAKIDDQSLKEAKQLLPKLLKKWNNNKDFGLPQVNEASSFFGNLFLDELDKWAIRHGYVFMRYVDDMRIFTPDEPTARRALAELITQLREMGLYVASGKTSIQPTAKVLKDLQDSSRVINLIEKEIKSGTAKNLEKASNLLESFINELIQDKEKFNDRHFRYCINRFRKLKVNNLAIESHQNVASEVLNRLSTMPHATDIFVDYLSLFPDNSSVQIRTLEFMESNYNIYPWQEMLLLELLIRFDIQPECLDRALSIARTIARNSYKHPACRQKAFVFWGKNGDYADRREIRAWYHHEQREDIRRAILFAIQEMQDGERNNFLKSVVNDSTAIKMTAEYVESLGKPTYHFYNPPKGFELSESWDSNDIDNPFAHDT